MNQPTMRDLYRSLAERRASPWFDGLSTRTKNALRNANDLGYGGLDLSWEKGDCPTCDQIRQTSDRMLLRIAGFGRKGLNEVRATAPVDTTPKPD